MIEQMEITITVYDCCQAKSNQTKKMKEYINPK